MERLWIFHKNKMANFHYRFHRLPNRWWQMKENHHPFTSFRCIKFFKISVSQFSNAFTGKQNCFRSRSGFSLSFLALSFLSVGLVWKQYKLLKIQYNDEIARNERVEDVPNNAQCTINSTIVLWWIERAHKLIYGMKMWNNYQPFKAHEFRIACGIPSINRLIAVFLVFVFSINIRKISAIRSLLSFDSYIFVAHVSFKILILDASAHIPRFFFCNSPIYSKGIEEKGIEFYIPQNRIP